MPTQTPPTIDPNVVTWLEHTGVDSPTAAAELLNDYAVRAAALLTPRPGHVEDKTAVVDISPRNGYRYLMVITRLAVPGPVAGGLAVLLPEWNVGLVLDATGYHMPSYVHEKLHSLDGRHAAVVAAFTTLLSAQL